MDELNFDEWKDLHERDPEMFEQKRWEFINQYITDMYPDDEDRQQRGRAFLWRMEQNYRHIKDPTERFNQVVAEFWKQVQKFQEALNSFDK